MSPAGHPVLTIRRRPAVSEGRLCGRLEGSCALGRAGIRAIKREGDGATPLGTFTVLAAYYRADRGPRPATRLPLRAIDRRDGWCDAPMDRNYNRRVRLPYPASAESLWRDDGLYDLVIVLSHNQRPRVRGAGSAIFVHVAPPAGRPTAGCIGLATRLLRRLLRQVDKGDRITILP
jgi:L,D-peptidoglycan transpeptidase YkuD (ErfK/YbiS/YcfS/YnhG family)